jgi:peptidyl-prolyl isomerase H (cyclophilin H)
MSAAQLGTAIPGAGTKGRPVVFFDVAIGDQPAGRIKMELYSDSVPK